MPNSLTFQWIVKPLVLTSIRHIPVNIVSWWIWWRYSVPPGPSRPELAHLARGTPRRLFQAASYQTLCPGRSLAQPLPFVYPGIPGSTFSDCWALVASLGANGARSAGRVLEPGANVSVGCNGCYPQTSVQTARRSVQCRKWFGVNGVLSAGLADWYVNGREFISASAPTMAVINFSSVMSAFPRMALMAFFAAFIMVSCAPLKCGASGGLNVHVTPLFAIDFLILSGSNSDINVFSSLSAALKFVPLSENISSGSPRRLAIL